MKNDDSAKKPTKIKIIISDITGSKHAEITLNPLITGAEIIEKLIERKFIEGIKDRDCIIQHMKTQRQIQPSQSLQDANVQSGDRLILGVMTRGG
jgi:hypothetical protein